MIPYLAIDVKAIDLFDLLGFVAFFLFLGVVSILIFTKFFSTTKKERKILLLGLIFRIMCTLGYYLAFINSYADAKGYFNYAYVHKFNLKGLFVSGSSFINNLSSAMLGLLRVFENSYLMMYLPYSIVGFWGVLFFYLTVKKIFTERPSKRVNLLIWLCVFFMPNMIFWSSNIGKDSVIFLGINLYLYSVICVSSTKNKVIFGAIALFIVYLVRPHVFLFLLISTILGGVLQKRGANKSNWIFVAASMVVLILFYNKVFLYAGIDTSENENVTLYYEKGMQDIEQRANTLSKGGSGIKRTSINVLYAPLYAVGFITQPFIWQVRKLNHLISAFDSIILQIILIYMMLNIKNFIKSKNPFKYFLLIFLIITTFVFGMGFTNIGLIVRQKNMVTSALLLLFFIIVSNKNETKN